MMQISSCEDHKTLLAEALYLDYHKFQPESYSLMKEKVDRSISIIGYTDREADTWYAENLHLTDDPEASTSECEGRVPDHEWIDQNIVLEWITTCQRDHLGTCDKHFSNTFTAQQPTYLVDTWLKCIIATTGNEPYVCLSYVWGGVDSFRALKRNRESLLRPQALAPGNGDVVLPDTVRDAMEWVKVLNERYLWVDSLCILQDDEHKHTELLKMSAIYANASFTIIAAQGSDANYGLRGLKGFSRPRNLENLTYPIGSARVGIPMTSRFAYPKPPCPWKIRGWTFQEGLFASRRLVFEDDSVRWECDEGYWAEDFKSMTVFLPIITQ